MILPDGADHPRSAPAMPEIDDARSSSESAINVSASSTSKQGRQRSTARNSAAAVMLLAGNRPARGFQC